MLEPSVNHLSPSLDKYTSSLAHYSLVDRLTRYLLLVEEVENAHFVHEHAQNRPTRDIGWDLQFFRDPTTVLHAYYPSCLRSHSRGDKIKGL